MQRIGVRRRLSTFLTGLLLASLLAALVPASSSPLLPEDAAAVGPPVYACASLFTGALRSSPSGTCTPGNEVLVNLNGDPSITVCASLYTGMLRYPFGGPCTSSERSLLLPGVQAVNLCANRSTGRLRYQPNGQCPAGEGLVLIPQANDPPVAQDDAFTLDEDTVLNGNVLADNGNGPDSDIEGDPLSVNPTPLSGPSNGLLVLAANGDFTYTPNPDFFGVDAFTYQLLDGQGGTDVGLVTITVNPLNDEPSANPQSVTTDEDVAVVITLTGTDVDGDALTFAIGTGPASGGLGAITPVSPTSAQVTYTPNLNFNGPDSFTFTVDDGTATSPAATVDITVDVVNDPPVAQDDAFTTDEDTPLNGNVLADNGSGPDTDPEGDPLTVNTTPVTPPSNGNLTLNADGSFSYTPDLNFNGSDSFEYEVSDGNGGTDVGLVTITVNPVNDAPVAQDDAFTTDEDVPLNGNVLDDNGAGIDADVDGDPLTVNTTPVSGPANGLLTLNADGSFTYTPNLDFNGLDSFTYEVCDPAPLCDTATVTITVDAVNDPPVAQDDAFTTDEDMQVAGNVLADNGAGIDDDVDGDPLTVNTTPVSGPANGLLVLEADGDFTYTPNLNFNGVDSFVYEVCDPEPLCDTATVTITVNALNDEPTDIQLSGATVNENAANFTVIGILTGSDPDVGDTLTFSLTDDAGGRFLVIQNGADWELQVADGSLLDFETDPSHQITVRVTDLGGLFYEENFTITLNDLNEAPVVDDQVFGVDENSANGALVGTVAATDPDTGQSLTYAITAGNTGNTFAIDPDTGQITVADNTLLDFETTPIFNLTVEVTDDGAPPLSDTATITINLNDLNEAPTVDDQSFTIPENSANSTLVGAVVAADPDAGQTLTFAITAGNGSGAFAINPNTGQITVNDSTQLDFETTPSFSLTVEVTDDGAPPLSDTATVTIDLTDVNDPPVVDDQTFNVDENSPNTTSVGTVAASDEDVPAQNLTFAITGGDPGGAFAIDPNTGAITVANDTLLDFETTPVFNLTVEVTDDGAPAESDTATITINLNDVNEAPVVNDQSFDVPENTANGALVATVAATDPDTGQTLTYAITGGNTSGTFAINASTGEITVADNTLLDFEAGNPPFSLTVEVTDNGVSPLSDTATVTITITNVNETPTDIQLSDSDIEENSALGTLIGTLTATDPDVGDTFTFTVQLDPDNKFAIVGDELRVDGALDFETDPSHDVTIRVTDAGGLFYDELFTITVIDVNEAPLAVQDDEDAYTNTELAAGGATITGLAGITSATGALANDSDPDTNPAFNVIAIDAGSGASANGGTFSIAAGGAFTYTPPAGFTGVDTFTYTLRDNGPSGGLTATGTVQITVAGTPVWYVDTSAGTNGDGASTEPFNVITAATVNGAGGAGDVDAANDIIYVATGTGNSGALGLEAGQRLIGEGVALDVLFLGNPTTIAAAGTRPTMGTTTLATNNTVRGLNVNAATGVTGADVDALILNNVGITSTSGSALDIAGGTAAMAVSIDSLSASSGASPGVQATGNNMGTLVISGSTNTITSTTGTALNVANTTIGAGDLNFQSISKNGGSNQAISLANTGIGQLRVTGSGATDGSGGTIENITGADAIRLDNTDGLVLLQNMIIEDIAAANDATDPIDTISGVDAIHGQQVDGGLALDNTTIRRVSDNAINGSLFSGGGATVWNGLLIINGSLIENSNRFHVTSRADSNNEGMVRILGIRGTVIINDSTLQDGGELLDFFVTAGTLDLTATNSDFLRAYKEFVQADNVARSSVGGHCIDVTVQGAANADVTIGDQTSAALGNAFLNCAIGSVRVLADAGNTGHIDAVVANNTFTVNDHSSGFGGDFDFPQGGVLIGSVSAPSSSVDTRVSDNYFDETTRASGGSGTVTFAANSGTLQGMIDGNTFDTLGDGTWYVIARNDPNASATVRVEDNSYIYGFFSCPDPACDSGGGSGGYFGPALYQLAEAQQGAEIHLTVDGEVFNQHDDGFYPGNSLETRVTGPGSLFCLNLSNNRAPEGYALENIDSGGFGTYNLYQGVSGSMDPATVVRDNNNLGGDPDPPGFEGGDPNLDPPVVTFGDPLNPGPVNVVTTACNTPAGAMFN